MATVPLPKITYRPALPQALIDRGGVSAVQLEGIALVGQQNEIILPNGSRSSALIGDGTGVGKGRESAGILYDNYLQGRKRLVWVSEKWDLMQAAMADFDGMGATELMRGVTKQGSKYVTGKNPAVIGLDKFKDPTKKIEHDGVLFTTYALIRSGDKKGNKRVHQLEQYLRGDDDGEGAYILFDESHNLKNAVPGATGGSRGKAKPSQIGVAVKELLERIPKLRTASLSATAATDVSNLGYLDRLGLWGPGTAFANGFRQFQAEIASGGLAAMELIAREMKALGKYISRTLSFKGVTFNEAEHKLSDDQKAIYRTSVKAWATVIERAEKTIRETTNGGSVARRNFMSQLGGTQQRFYSLLISTLKIPTAVELANKALADGKAVVISLVNTNEAAQNREMNKARKRSDEDEEEEAAELQEYDFGPKEMLKNLVETHYPVQQFMDDVDSNGNPIKVPVFRDGPNGEKIPVNNPQAEAERKALLDEIDRDLHMPANPLDELVSALGGRNKVAELTGRKKIYDRDQDKFVPRGDPNVPQEQYNLVEMAKFQNGEKLVAVLSSAAGTGISLHASNRAKNQRKRYMITLQVGWSADKAMQMLGRVHRTDQAHPPEYMLLVSDLGGEKRFIATIARRLGSLGALTKGQKNATGGSDLMSKVNFESDQGRQAAKSFYLGMMEDKPIPGTGRTGMEILHAMRMLVVDPKSGRRTVPEEDQSNITRLLNRMLALDPEVQNGCYNYYFDIFQAAVEDAISRGTLDTGVRTLPGDEISLKPQRTIATDPKTGATTHYQPLTAKIRMERVSPAELKSRLRQYATANVRIIVNDKGDKLALLQDAAPIVHADGSVEPAVYMSAPGRGRWQKIAANTLRGWKPVEQYGKEQKDKATATLESAQRNLDYYKGQQEADTKRERERLTRDAQTRLNRAETMASNYASYPELQARYTQDIAKAKEDLAKASTYEAPVDSYTTDRIKSYEEAVDQAQKTIEQKADLFEDADGWAHTRWEDLYEASPTHETREHHLITGAVMRFWNPIKEAAQLRNSIFTATDSKTGKRVVGIDIPDGEIGRLLPRIEGGHSTVNAAQLESDVLRNGLTYELETGIQVRRNKVSRESVIQLIPQTQDAARRLIALGVAYERGVTAVYYVPNKNTSVILNRVLAEFPVKTDAANRESGGGVYLGSGLGALQSVFDRGGLTAQLKNVSRFFSQVADDTKRVFAPQTRGTQARVAAGSFREMMGTLAQNEAQVHAALEDYRKAFRQMPAEHGVHGLSVIDAIEGGPQEINNLPTELRPFATTVRGLYEDRKNLLDGLGLVKHFLENYFTHMYKNPAEAEAWTANWMSKRPMAGKEAFRKKRVYPTLREALEDPDFSLVAKFDNPVDYVYAGLAQMDKSIAAHDLFNEWSDAGYLKYSLKRPDGGFSQIDDKLFTVRGPRRGAVKIDPTEPTIRPGEDPDEFESRHYAWESKMEAIDEGFIKPGDVTVYGQRTMGHYWAPDQMAQVANNYLSPGLQGKAAFDAWMKVKNGMNAINLGFSAFHGLTTTLNSSLSDVALGFQQVFAGKPARAAVSIGRGFVPFASIVQDYLRGTRLGKVWDGTAPNPTAQELAIVDALRQAGGRYKQSNDAGPLLEGLKKAWGENKVGGVVRAFNPWLWAEQSMRPIMEKLVPAAKMGAFSKMVQLEIERNPGMDVDEARKKFGEALDSIDNRMGQLNQRNMLMNNTVRAWMNAIVGRPGWNLGTIREIVGGGGDLAQNIYDLSRGKPTQLSNRTAYVLAMLLAGAVFNGVLTFMLTGDAPEGMDFIAPRDGGLTESGHESRIVLPLYLSKDLYSWATHPLRTLKAKMAQPLMVMGDLATNRDFYQRKIYGRGGIGLDSYLMHLFFPYVLSGTLQNFGRGESLGKTLLPLVGVMPASRDAGLSKAEKILDEYRQEQMASTRPAPTDHSRARSKMMMAAERGDVDKVRELAMDGIEKGILSKRDADAAMKRIDTPLIVSEVQAVNDMEVLMNAYDAATPKERDVIEDAVRAKLAKARLDPWKWTPRARKLAAKYFDVEIPGGNDASAEDLGTPASLEGTA